LVTVECFGMHRDDPWLETERIGLCRSNVNDAKHAGTKSNFKIVSVNNVEFENLLHESITNGE